MLLFTIRAFILYRIAQIELKKSLNSHHVGATHAHSAAAVVFIPSDHYSQW